MISLLPVHSNHKSSSDEQMNTNPFRLIAQTACRFSPNDDNLLNATVVTAFGFGAWSLPYLVWGSNMAHQVTCFMFVFLTLALPRLYYFSEYEILTAVPNYWAHS